MCDDGYGVGAGGRGVFLDLGGAIAALGEDEIRDRYGNLFEMYERITGEDPYRQPMRIYPAPHYVMGGLWVDYALASTIPGLFVLGEANFSDHGANRLGASALMQGLADGYFIVPYSLGEYLAGARLQPVTTTDAPFVEAEERVLERTTRLLSVRGARTVDSFHRELGAILWERCGMSRTEEGLREAIERIRELRERFWAEVRVPGAGTDLNQELEKAGRVADYFELGELMCLDALERRESCGAHFREEFQTQEGEALRDDARFSHVAVWEHAGEAPPVRHTEPLEFRHAEPTRRSYA
jgi:succinate dehydrogenase / fumarate reductase flavoprotein subunit